MIQVKVSKKWYRLNRKIKIGECSKIDFPKIRFWVTPIENRLGGVIVKKGLLIVFEGLDGSGKTTQINLKNHFYLLALNYYLKHHS